MHGTSKAARWASFSMAVLCLLSLCYLIPQFFYRFHTQQVYTDLRHDDLAKARADLDAARNWLGPLVSRNDTRRINLAGGELSLRLAEAAPNVTALLQEMEMAETHFAEAVALDQLDIDGYTGLARATAALEKVYPFVHRKPFKTSALPVFERLVELMPVNMYSLALLTKYYLSKNMTAEVHATVGRSISLYPPLYYQLIRQPFYSMAMNEMLKKSLFTAIENGVYVEQAYKVLSNLAVKEEDYPAAIVYFQKSKLFRPYGDNSGYDLQLGNLYLQTDQFAEAESSFLESLQTTDKESRLNEIWNSYNAKKRYSEFMQLCKGVDDARLSEVLEIVQAKCLIEMGRYELANSHLIRIDSRKYAAESLYLQGYVAELQKDWDIMELRSQRATVLEPGNSKYHLLFSRALKNQKKWPQAERAAGEAIRTASKPASWLYNHRAWIRWSLKDFDGAQDDWESAIEISPENGWFYYSMALVYEQGGNVKEAIRQLNKALALKPEEPGFLKKHNELLKKQQL
jgi:tetratricopeptide (TPR) repeat protein